MTVHYTQPSTDNVPERYPVSPLHAGRGIGATVKTVEEEIELYLETFRTKFEYPLAAQRREWSLARFVSYLKSRQHSLWVDEFTMADGQDFLDWLVNARNGSALSRAKKKLYRSALRSLSRFLHRVGRLENDLFLPLTLN
jgi:hypothetical protein